MLVKSRYNLHCEDSDGKHLLYNTASGHFAALDEFAWASYLTCDTDACPELESCGFLVDEALDELEGVQDGFRKERTNTSRLSLALAPTYACNCACAYCYEQDKITAKSLMSPEVVESIYRFVEERYASLGFSELFVEWYGGDPSLCLDLVKDISDHFASWCNSHAVLFEAMMLTNANLIHEEEAQLLWDAHVRSLYITIDGPEDVHNYRRPAANQDNPYQNIKDAIAALKAKGMQVIVGMNADKVNLPLLPQLQKELSDELDVEILPAKLNDYAHSYGSGRFSAPHFDLYTHDEYAVASFEIQRQIGFKKGQIKALLSPCPRFCYGQVDNYYVIDAFGDVYKCDGWMGDKSRSIFNLLEDEPVLDAITFDPFEDEDCTVCELLPVCMGNCSWERERCGWPCHPLKLTYADYLKEWRKEYSSSSDGFTLFE